jgi:hypothetical protein
MPGRLKCNSCGATWPDPKVTGFIYAHQCPEKVVDTPEVTNPLTGDIITQATFKPTPNPRNENLKRNPDKPSEYVIVSEGTGVTEV